MAYQNSITSVALTIERRIFYSWQSTLPNYDNRGFIAGCLQKAVHELNASLLESEHDDVPYEVDKDTQGLSGSPNIFDSILQKIDQSGVFVADVTLLAQRQSNSNVMIELGYAIAKLGKNRILMVFNEAYGSERDAPFDLGFKRLITYKYRRADVTPNVEDKEKTLQRMILTAKIQSNIRQIIGDDS